MNKCPGAIQLVGGRVRAQTFTCVKPQPDASQRLAVCIALAGALSISFAPYKEGKAGFLTYLYIDRYEKQGSEKSSSFPKVTQRVGEKGWETVFLRLQSHGWWFSRLWEPNPGIVG